MVCGALVVGVPLALAGNLQPDGWIKRSSDPASDYLGKNVYNHDGAHQTRGWRAKRGQTRVFDLILQNDGNQSDTLRVNGCGSKNGIRVQYFDGDSDVTKEARNGSYVVFMLGIGVKSPLELRITPGPMASVGGRISCLVKVSSDTSKGTKFDAVKARLRVVSG